MKEERSCQNSLLLRREMGLGARDSTLIPNLGKGKKQLNWTPDVAPPAHSHQVPRVISSCHTTPFERES